MKVYAYIVSEEDTDIVLEDGGYANICNNGDEYLVYLYQGRIQRPMNKNESIIDVVLESNRNIYIEKFPLDTRFRDVIKYACDWLVFPVPEEGFDLKYRDGKNLINDINKFLEKKND